MPGKLGRILEADPEVNCFLPGVPRATYLPHPFQIFQSAKVIWIVYQYSYARREIPLDKPSKAPIESWMGWSNGHWEGDTLVVDVTAFNDLTWFDNYGHVHSDKMRVIERFTRVDLGHLNASVMVDDPGAYSRPFTLNYTAELIPTGDLMEYVCENEQDAPNIDAPADAAIDAEKLLKQGNNR